MSAPWDRFFVLWLACCLATGVMPGSALFINIFSDAGVYRSVCTSVERTCRDQHMLLSGIFNAGGTLSVVFLCPIGMVYDRWGARFAGCVGASLCALGLALITVSLWGSQAGYDDKTRYVFIIGVFVCDFGAQLNSFSFMGLIWHFPGRQSLILALINATYQVSAFTPLVVSWLLVCFDLVVIMAVFTVMVCLTAWVCWACVPSKEEFYREAKRVLGMPLPRPDTRSGWYEMLRRSLRLLRMEAIDHIVSGAAFTTAFAFPTFYSSTTALYGEALFGHEEDGEGLAILYVSLTAAIGASLAPAAGWLADRLGISMCIFVCACTQLLGTATCGLASWVAQTISCACQILVMSVLQMLIFRYLLQYAPPNRVGTVQGIYCMLLAPALLALLLPLLAWFRSLGQDVNEYRLPMCTVGGLSTASMFLFAWYYQQHPPPEVPKLLPEDESELAMGFGCKSFEEVMEIVHIESRSELIELMASTSPKDMHKLISMIDVGQLMLMMQRRSVEDLANMLETSAAEESDAEESGFRSDDGFTLTLSDNEDVSDGEFAQIGNTVSGSVSCKGWADLLRERSELRGHVERMMRIHFERKVLESSQQLLGTDLEITSCYSDTNSDGTASSSSSNFRRSRCVFFYSCRWAERGSFIQ